MGQAVNRNHRVPRISTVPIPSSRDDLGLVQVVVIGPVIGLNSPLDPNALSIPRPSSTLTLRPTRHDVLIYILKS